MSSKCRLDYVDDLSSEEKLKIWSRLKKYVKPVKCWEWIGCDNGNGYGAFNLDNKKVYPHILSFILHRGKTNGLLVCHKCDNPKCLNPNHHFLGTDKDNSLDRDIKQRTAKGEKNGTAKISEQFVLEIRDKFQKGVRQKDLVIEYGLGSTQIHRIVKRKRWQHLN